MCFPLNFFTTIQNFFKMVKAAFGQRRKTVLNSTAAGLSLGKEQVAAALERAGIAPNSRAEQLTMEQLATLSNELFIGE